MKTGTNMKMAAELYIFSGKKQKANLTLCLTKHCNMKHVGVDIVIMFSWPCH
jgi:hypothetical protein